MDLLEEAWRWRRWTATGPEDAISKVFTILDANPPSGWRRLSGDDLLPFGSLVRPGSGWYGLDSGDSGAPIALSIERLAPHELRSGWAQFPPPPRSGGPSGVPAEWAEVGRFLDEGIIPAARAAGVTFRVPTPQEVFFSELPYEVQRRLRRFLEASHKSLPLEPKEAELWREFVVAVFRMDARFDTEPFINWLAAAGWSRESAAELYSQLLDDCLLLSRYTDEVSAA